MVVWFWGLGWDRLGSRVGVLGVWARCVVSGHEWLGLGVWGFGRVVWDLGIDQLLMLRIHLDHVCNEFIDLELTVACATAVGEVLLSLLETARRWLQFETP